MVPLILLKMKLENALLWKRRINYRALNRSERGRGKKEEGKKMGEKIEKEE